MVFFILKEARRGSMILVNGCFWEVSIARHLKKFRYVAKVPGDIVWERARISGEVTASIDKFQDQKLSLLFRILRYFFSFSLQNAESVIVPSKHLYDLCEKWDVHFKKLLHIGNAVSLDIYYPDESKRKEFDFVTVCRLVPWKRVDEVLIAASKLNASVLIVGNGPERGNLESLATKLGVKALFTGEVQQAIVPEILRKCRTFVLNSNFEATSYALLEAQASGLLVIANEQTGSEEVISHKNTGFLCGPTHGLALLEAMKLTLQKTDQLERMKINAIESVKHNFNLNINYARILSILMGTG
jgi:glycosyltransferase involved in cell wall biosynthesis